MSQTKVQLINAGAVVEADIANDAVTRDKINVVSTSSAPGIEIKGDDGSQEGYLQLNCRVNSHGVKIQSPAHSSSQSYKIILPDNQIAADKVLKVKSITGSGSTAVGQLEFADAAGGVTSDAQSNTVAGTGAGANFSGTDATNNTLYGKDAGNDITTGDDNTAIGVNALALNTTGSENVAIGKQSLDANTTGIKNVAIGKYSLSGNTTANYNTAVGDQALFTNSTGSANVAVGRNAMYANTTGSNHVAVGNFALDANTTGADNVAIGVNALTDNTTGTYNTALGAYAVQNNTTASYNTGLGYGALADNTTGYANTAAGYLSGSNITTAWGCTTIGSSAGIAITTGQDNTCIGYVAGASLTTGTQNCLVGVSAGDSLTTALNSNAFGFQALETGTTTSESNAFGYHALKSCTGNTNAGFGHLAGKFITSGRLNSCLGAHAPGYDVTTGSNNLLLGNDAGRSNSPSGSITTGSNNVCLGDNSISNLFCADTSISSSDSRDKTDVSNFTIGLDWIKALRPITYRWDRRTWYGTEEDPYGTPDGSKKRAKLHIGFLAQEALDVEKANGYGASNDDSLVVNLTEDGMSYGMKYERLVPILVNAIKELSAEISALKAA